MIGTNIGGFEIRARIGSGGMGVVYSAWDKELKRLVALKALPESARGDPVRWRRFQREAEAAAALSHPSICQIHRFLEDTDPPSLILELVTGPALSQRIAEGPMPLAEAVTLIRRVAEGLAEAHAKSVVHRDVKPGNILLTEDGRPKLTDFGLAVIPDVTRLTLMPSPMGTVSYMSPEQIAGEDPIPQMDVWSLGVVMFELLTGERPFHGGLPEQVFLEIRRKDPPLVSDLRPETPDAVVAIVQRALERDTAARYPDAGAMVRDLMKVEQSLISESVPARDLPRTHATRFRKRMWWALVLAGVIAVVALVIKWIPGGDAPPRVTVNRITANAWWEGDPSLSPDGLRVAYAASRDGNADIYISAADGGRPFRLTEDPAEDNSPVWLPDANELLFVSTRSGDRGIWRIGQYGGNAMLVVPGAIHPAVSPDGEWLAFVTLDEHGESRIAVAPLADPDQARIITGAEHGLMLHGDPAWSPDSRRICYSAYDGLWVVDRTGVQPRRLDEGGDFSSDSVWSPDGAYIYYSSMDRQTVRICRVPADGGRVVDVTQGTGPERHPTISGSGSRLVYSTQRHDADLVVRDLESGAESRIGSVTADMMATVSRDGSKVVFVSDRWGGTSDLWIQDLHERTPVGEPRLLFDSPYRCSMPEISADSRRVVFYVIDDDTRHLMMIKTTGGEAVALTAGQVNDSQPHWSPDGRSVVFTSEDRGGRYGLWRIEVGEDGPGGQPVRIDTGHVQLYLPRWSPSGKRIAGIANADGALDIWVHDFEGGMRCITRDASVQRVRWGDDDTEIWAVGNWGADAPSLRIVDVETGENQPLDPVVRFAPTNEDPSIDVAVGARILVYTDVTSGGDLWMLEAVEGGF